MDSSNHRIGIQHWAPEGIAGEHSHVEFRPFLEPPPILKKSSAKGVLCFKVVEYYWTIIAGPQLNRRQ
jgi:hypothetical protein